MVLDYSSLPFDQYGRPEKPELLLKTLSGEVIGVIPGVSNLNFSINFAEVSQISFDVSAKIDGVKDNWIFDQLVGYKVIYTENYGVYVINNPSNESDGIMDVAHITGFSLENVLAGKQIFLEEGTYKFCNIYNTSDTSTIVGRIREIAPDWDIGYVDPSVAQIYRTFEEFDDYLLPFIYNSITEKYRCIVSFDTYTKTINIYNADDERPTLPIYLDFDNLITSVTVDELTDEIVTAISPYGSDSLNVLNVNPIGSNWIYDLSYFIENGDIPADLAEKWRSWQYDVISNMSYYKGLTGLRASAIAQTISAQVELTALKGELDSKTNQQSVTVQAMAEETSTSGKNNRQQELNAINGEIRIVNSSIASKQAEYNSYKAQLDETVSGSYAQQIKTLVDSLRLENNFISSELDVLRSYFIEQNLTEETFVAPSGNTVSQGTSFNITNGHISISNTKVERVPITGLDKEMYVFTGGQMNIVDGSSVSADLIRGTLETNISDNNCVFSAYVGQVSTSTTTAPSGIIVLSGGLSNESDNIQQTIEDNITYYTGSNFSATITGKLFVTANVSSYQQYSVEMELFDYASDVLADVAIPTYEFSVDSGNFLFAKEFEAFRDSLELGKGIYLNVGFERSITPIIIGMEFGFDDLTSFSMVFSNRFKRHDGVNTFKNMLAESYSSSRSFDAGKYTYSRTAEQMSSVTEFMNSSLDAAVNSVLAGANQSVKIDGTGIQISDGDYQIRMVDKMIAMTDDNWQTAKVAIGYFKTLDDNTADYFGVNAEVIAGKLIVGNNLVIENATDEGVMQFMVDSSGAWLNNSTLMLQKDNGGKILIDPRYGIIAGNGNLFRLDGTNVVTAFDPDNTGGITLKKTDGISSDVMPMDSTFFMDINNGNAYFEGTVFSNAGSIGGWKLESDKLSSGSGSTYVALNSSASSDSNYAIWAGATNAAAAPFSVTRSGKVTMNSGTFRGDLNIGNGKFSVNNAGYATMTSGKFSGTLDIGNGNFVVDSDGNVTMKGNITWAANGGNSPSKVLYISYYHTKPADQGQYGYFEYSRYPENETPGWSWHRVYNKDADIYASYSYDGGLTWTNGMKITAADAESSIASELSSDSNDGIYSFTDDDGKLRIGINASYVNIGDLDMSKITVGSYGSGYLSPLKESNTSRNSVGIQLSLNAGGGYYSDSEPRLFVMSGNNADRVGMKYGSKALYIQEAIYATDAILDGYSDARLKHNIRYGLDKYAHMFSELKPVTFSFNHDYKDKMHFGFIAQDVLSLMGDCGIDINNQSIVFEHPEDEEGNIYYGINYDEFIPMNTYMIQKLIDRVTKLEHLLEVKDNGSK